MTSESLVDTVFKGLKLRADAGIQQSEEWVYQALGKTADGIRAGYHPAHDLFILLIEVPSDWKENDIIPEWNGMGHEIVNIRFHPTVLTRNLKLTLTSSEHFEVFLLFCEDLVCDLENETENKSRVQKIESCLLRWRKFFERSGRDGLTLSEQQGLFAELVWMKRLLEADIQTTKVVLSWKGCERGFHDFDFEGHVVEVKSTKTKEPRSVIISNERQLDERGLKTLYLYVLSLGTVNNGGTTLSELVSEIQGFLSQSPWLQDIVRRKLISAGYLQIDSIKYTTGYECLKEELFKIESGFPRIVNVPEGIGELHYKLMINACQPFMVQFQNYFSKVRSDYASE